MFLTWPYRTWHEPLPAVRYPAQMFHGESPEIPHSRLERRGTAAECKDTLTSPVRVQKHRIPTKLPNFNSLD